MLEGSRVVIPRLADCSSGSTDFCEPALATSGCALAAAETVNIPANIAANRMRLRRELPRMSFMEASLKGIRAGFKAAQNSNVDSFCQARGRFKSPQNPVP